MRANKPFTIIATSKKEGPPVLWKHCRFHRGARLIEGYLCQFCGPTLPAIRTVDVYRNEKEEKSS